MKMGTYVSMKRWSTVAVWMAISALVLAGSDDAYLEIDGLVNVAGGPHEEASVSLRRDSVRMELSLNDPRHLRARLELQGTYTLSFERPGYRTKQLFFDTRMDAALAAEGPFVFRFEVALEPLVHGGTSAYIGPVGYIRFDPSIGDFGFDVDYRLTHDEQGHELARPPSRPSVSVSDKRDPRERRWSPPFIDPTREMELAAKGAQELGARVALPVQGIAVGNTSSSGESTMPLPVNARVERSVIVEGEREITIVRVRANGILTEYRRIAHDNGTVLHYKNGSSCTYQEYMRAVGP
jgi:hypothetical protein